MLPYVASLSNLLNLSEFLVSLRMHGNSCKINMLLVFTHSTEKNPQHNNEQETEMVAPADWPFIKIRRFCLRPAGTNRACFDP